MSRYRAAHRAVELVNSLQDKGLTLAEIAAEMRRSGVAARHDVSDPAADLCASVQDMVADFAKAMGQPLPEDALRARAEDAEQRAEVAEAALAQARAELKRTKMAVATAYTDLPVWSESALAHLSPAERGADEVRAALGRFMRAEAQPAGEVSDG